MKRKQLCAAILLMAVAVAVGSGGTGDQSVDHVQLNSTVGVQTKKKKVVKTILRGGGVNLEGPFTISI